MIVAIFNQQKNNIETSEMRKVSIYVIRMPGLQFSC